MTGFHTLSPAQLDALATGGGGAGVVGELWRAQHSRRLLLLRLVIERLRPGPARDDAVAAIVAAEAADRTAARPVLVEPMVGSWAAATVRRLTGTGHAGPADRGHLGAVAAAAALRAGSRAEVAGHSRGGWVYLPTLGRARSPVIDGSVTIRTDAGRLWLDGAEIDRSGPAFAARRRIGAVEVEDLDPYRDAYQVPAAGRLTAGEFGVWRRCLAEAWQILTAYAPERAAELAAGLRSLVPLTKPEPAAAHSATFREAVGVVGLDLPDSPAEFAVALVHEFQHSKLTSLLDIVPMHDSGPGRRFFAPWRPDPRPIGGLFQGVYAFLGVADLWRALSAEPERFPQARAEFADARVQVAAAHRTLAGSGLLTAPGQRFVNGMGAAIDALHAVRLPRAAVVAAERRLADRRTAWRAAAPIGDRRGG